MTYQEVVVIPIVIASVFYLISKFRAEKTEKTPKIITSLRLKKALKKAQKKK